MILGRPITIIPYSELKIEYTNEFNNKSLYKVLLSLAKDQVLVWVNGNPAYTDDIRADYINKELYIPVFLNDIARTKDRQGKDRLVTYNNRVEKVVLHSYNSGFHEVEILVQKDINSNKVWKLDIHKLKIERELSNKELLAKDLFERYVAYSYKYIDNEIDIFKFNEVKSSKMSNFNRKYIKNNGLSFYGEYIDMNYRDVRHWKLEELKGKIDDEVLLLTEYYGYRRLRFELELYLRILNKVYWEEWTLGSIQELLNNQREFIKYKQNRIYIIFKRRWVCLGKGV